MNSIDKPYLTTLTPLRGIAALLVVVFHANLMLKPFIPRGEGSFINAGWLWVDFFFILSGFILSYVYSNTFKEQTHSSTYWKYIGARFARIYPLHFFTLIWSLICALFIHAYANNMDPFFATMLNPNAAPASVLLIQSLHLYRTPPLNTPSWSLSTEWWVYMIFPFLVPYFSRIRVKGMIFTLVLITGFFLVIKYLLGPPFTPFTGGSPSINVTADFGIFRCLAGFLLGMLAFTFYNINGGYRFLKQDFSFLIFFVGAIAAMSFSAEDMFILAFFPFIILAAAYNNGTIKRLLETAPLQRLGDWSFSIYMVHVPIMQIFTIFFVKKNPDFFAKFPPVREVDFTVGVTYCAIIILLTLLVSSVTYRYIEVPARTYLNKLFKSRQRQGMIS